MGDGKGPGFCCWEQIAFEDLKSHKNQRGEREWWRRRSRGNMWAVSKAHHRYCTKRPIEQLNNGMGFQVGFVEEKIFQIRKHMLKKF